MSLFTIKTSLYVSVFSLLILTINAQLAGTWPKLDLPPPPKAEWTKLVDMAKVPAAPLSKVPGDCGAKDNFCNWSCTQCVRTNTTDIIQCPNKYDWGLTFDDGPTTFTDTLLDYLSSVNTTITFFVVGSRITENPQILKKAVDAGHQIGVHTWSHTGLTTQTNEEIIAEMKWTELAIQTAVGLTPKYMRPPYGDVDDRVRGVLSQLGYKIVIWDKDTNDYVSADDPNFQLEWIEGNFTQWVQENDPTGHISLEHDLYQQTAARAPKVVPILQNAGFIIKPVALCVGDSNPYLESTGAATTVPAKAIVTPSATATETAPTQSPQSPANEPQATSTPMSTMSTSASTSNSLSNVNPHMNNNYYLLSLIPFIVASIII